MCREFEEKASKVYKRSRQTCCLIKILGRRVDAIKILSVSDKNAIFND